MLAALSDGNEPVFQLAGSDTWYAACRARRYGDQPAFSEQHLCDSVLRVGGKVIAVQKLLGHASVAATQQYLDHLALGELRAAVPPLPISPD